MLFNVFKPRFHPNGRDPENPMIHWHRVEMVKVKTVHASTPEDAIDAAKAAGIVAPIVQPAGH